MSTILAIETSSELASVAIFHEERIIARVASGVQTHSQTVLPMVQEVLAEAGIPLARCHAIAFGAGPGSFTGVRTACGVAQGLAFGAGLPVIPIVTLLAMTQACREATGADDVLAVLDARMEEVYWAQYRYQDGWKTVREPSLSVPSLVVPNGPVTACGNGLSAYPQGFSHLMAPPEECTRIVPHAAQVARLARDEFSAGRVFDARDAQPVYLRNKVALTTSERLAKGAA